MGQRGTEEADLCGQDSSDGILKETFLIRGKLDEVEESASAKL